MTDLQTVTLNECRNDASTVHLYFLDEAGMWLACGMSAFLLDRLAQVCGAGCITAYSESLMMPTAVVTPRGLQSVAASCSGGNEASGRVVLRSGLRIESKSYRAWARVLREATIDAP